MRRHAPEERFEEPPLFAFAQSALARRGTQGDPAAGTSSRMNQRADADPSESAANRAEVGMARAAERADRLDPDWQVAALDLVRSHANTHAQFLAEDVPHAIPEGADPRAFGAVMRAAAKLGYVMADGYAPANTSNRAPKTLWRSLIYAASTPRAAQP